MKSRLISLILVLALIIASAVGVTAVYKEIEEPMGHFAVMSDLHIKAESFYSDQQSYEYYSNIDKMIHLSEAIANSIVDELLGQKGLEAVFVPGDLTENGDLTSYIAARDILQRLVDGGIKVFVINGNHDNIQNSNQADTKATAQQFQETFWDMGYKNALVRDDCSLSYTADINDDFRIIAIDSDEYYNTQIEGVKNGIDTRLSQWIETQVKQAKADGKTPLAMAHHPLFNHWADVMSGILSGMGHAPDENATKLADILADNGCNYIFVGHLHGQSTKKYTSNKNNTLYEILTASTVYLPSTYRYIKFFQTKTDIKTAYVDKLNMDYIPIQSNASERQMINDFRSYARHHLSIGLSHSLDPQGVLDRVGISEENLGGLSDILEDLIESFINMPIYESDEYESLQDIIVENGGQPLRPSKYESMIEVVAFFVEMLNTGDQNVEKDSVEIEITIQAFKAIFYLLDEKSSEIQQLYPESPPFDIDTEELFSQGKLDLLDSDIMAFLYDILRDDLPSSLRNLNFDNLNNLNFLDMFLPMFLNNMLGREVVDSILECVGEKDIDIDMLLIDVLIGEILIDMIQDPNPIDNNIIINRKTMEIK